MTGHGPPARVPIELPIEYRQRNAFFADYAQCISRGSTFIPTRNPLPAGTRFLFRLTVPGAAPALELRGEVVEGGAERARPGMSIRFQWADAAERADFDRAVERLMSESLGPLVTAELLERALWVAG